MTEPDLWERVGIHHGGWESMLKKKKSFFELRVDL